MTEDALLKYAQPVLIGIGLIVVLNLWNIIQVIWGWRRNKDSKIDESLNRLMIKIIKLEAKFEDLSEDVNNIGKMIRESKK